MHYVSLFKNHADRKFYQFKHTTAPWVHKATPHQHFLLIRQYIQVLRTHHWPVKFFIQQIGTQIRIKPISREITTYIYCSVSSNIHEFLWHTLLLHDKNFICHSQFLTHKKHYCCTF